MIKKIYIWFVRLFKKKKIVYGKNVIIEIKTEGGQWKELNCVNDTQFEISNADSFKPNTTDN